MLTQTGE